MGVQVPLDLDPEQGRDAGASINVIFQQKFGMQMGLGHFPSPHEDLVGEGR